MNSFDLSRSWFNFSFENPEKIKPIHSSIFFFAIEHCNRLGNKEKFGFPSQMTMDAIGVKKYQTYGKALSDLEEWGFITFIERSKNQYSANIISINAPTKNGIARGKALDKATIKHGAKQGHSTGQGKDSIDKPLNQETIKPLFKDEDLKNELYVKPHLRDGFNPVSNDNQFNKHTFVAWFNTSLDYIGFNGALKSLSKEDNNKLNILLDKGYTIQDFKIAFKNFQGSTFYKKEGHITTTQFLKGDTFDRFLIMGDSKVKQTKGGDVTQW